MKKDFTLAVLIATALTLTGCATPPLLPFQVNEIARQKPRSVDQFVEMAAAIKEGEHIYRIDDSTTGIVVSGTGTLERAGWMLASHHGTPRHRAAPERQVAYVS